MEFTFGYRAYDSQVFNKCLAPSLKSLEEKFDVICEPPIGPISANYNRMLERCKTPYLILIHEDMGFSPDLIQRLQLTMKTVPDFGSIGFVGANRQWNGQLYFCCARADRPLAAMTLDCCFLVVRKDVDQRFDEETFNGLHQHVEDYTAALFFKHKLKNITAMTTYIDGTNGLPANAPESYLVHYCQTIKAHRSMWVGESVKYYRKLQEKWPGVATTLGEVHVRN